MLNPDVEAADAILNVIEHGTVGNVIDLGGGHGIVFEVLSVGDNHDGAALVLHPFTVGVAIAEGLHGLLYGIADGGALHADERAVYLVKEQLHGAVVVGQWHLHVAAAGKDHQRHTVAPQGVEQVGDEPLAAFQSVGLYVFGHHAVGDVQADGHVASQPLAFDHLAALLRVGDGEDKECRRQHDKAVFEGRPPARRVGYQTAEHATVGELGQLLPLPYAEQYPQRDKQGDEQQ